MSKKNTVHRTKLRNNEELKMMIGTREENGLTMGLSSCALSESIVKFFPVLIYSSYFIPTQWYCRASPTFLLSSLSMAEVQRLEKKIKKQLVEAVEEGTLTHLSPSFETNLDAPSFSLCCSVTIVLSQNR